jgi:hypothetical protein
MAVNTRFAFDRTRADQPFSLFCEQPIAGCDGRRCPLHAIRSKDTEKRPAKFFNWTFAKKSPRLKEQLIEHLRFAAASR